MYAATYVCVVMSLYVENPEVTLMPPILTQYCRIRDLPVTHFSGGEEPDSPCPESVYLCDRSSWIEQISPPVHPVPFPCGDVLLTPASPRLGSDPCSLLGPV